MSLDQRLQEFDNDNGDDDEDTGCHGWVGPQCRLCTAVEAIPICLFITSNWEVKLKWKMVKVMINDDEYGDNDGHDHATHLKVWYF